MSLRCARSLLQCATRLPSPTANKILPTFRLPGPRVASTRRNSSLASVYAMSNHSQFERTSGITDSVWVHHSPYSERPHFDGLTENIRTQTCVIGAGISGLSTAYELVTRKHEVVLVEAREVLSGETSRTSGHLASALDDGYVEISKKHGIEGAQAAADSHRWAVKRVGQIARELGIDCDYREIPGYCVSQFDRGTQPEEHAKDIKQLKEEAEFASKLNVKAEFREGLAVRGWDGKYDQRDALVVEGQARFHPTKYLNGLMAWLKKQPNFRCYTGTRVMLVEEKGFEILGHGNKEVHIQTEMGYNIRCQNAVEATCVPLQKLSVIAEMEFDRTYCVAIRVPKGSVEDCLLYDTADPYIYVRIAECDDKADYLIVGGGDHKVGQDDTLPRFDELENWARERFPQCMTVNYKWSGQIFEPVDYMAFIGKNQGCDHIYIVTGDSGNGLTHGVLAGRLLADQIAPQPAEQDESNRADKIAFLPDWAAVAKLYSPKRLGSILKSAPTMLAHDLQINAQYKRFLQSDISDIEDLAPGTGGVLNPLTKTPMAVFRDEQGNVTKMSALCPHMKGVVCWNQTEKSFDCPVHGSRFSPMGLCITGPSMGNLEPAEDKTAGAFKATKAAAKGELA